MDSKTIIVIIVALLMVAFVLYKIYQENGKEGVKKFLNTLTDAFAQIIIKHIDEVNFSDFNSLGNLEMQIINECIDSLWDLAKTSLISYSTNPVTKMAIQKLLTKENVEQFAEQVFKSNPKVQAKYTAKYNNAVLTANAKAQEFENETVTENEAFTENKVETKPVPDMDPNKNYTSTSMTEPDQTEVEKEIIPQHEEESEEVDPTDVSQEVINDDDEVKG